jgi:hypothetical protein
MPADLSGEVSPQTAKMRCRQPMGAAQVAPMTVSARRWPGDDEAACVTQARSGKDGPGQGDRRLLIRDRTQAKHT